MVSNETRVLLYSHDTVGLGHIRRNQAIACELSRSVPNPNILMVSGARQCMLYEIPSSVEFVTMPGLRKATDGSYVARNSALSTECALWMRSEVLLTVARTFDPHVVIVDKVPRGVCGELEPALRMLRESGRARIVLGFRDILDDAETVSREWSRDNFDDAIEQFYDSVWVYGDPRVCDFASEYHLPPSVSRKLEYLGYLDRNGLEGSSAGELPASVTDAESPMLCMVGGGEDGAQVALAFAQARYPAGSTGIVLTGPYMSDEVRQQLQHFARGRNDLQVLDFVSQPQALLERASRVVAMGGYNSVCEILTHQKPALIVPRVSPRQEQLIRAQRMEQLGLLQMLHPSKLCPAAITSWLQKPVDHVPAEERIRLGGLDAVACRVGQLAKSAALPPARFPELSLASRMGGKSSVAHQCFRWRPNQS
ncbi:MAG: hypothetical protein KDB14_27650 [Planctomycetales bacterium]|nr:hypothetical protein [Planctomycetales bacterium]